MDNSLEKYTQWLPEGEWLAYWCENGDYEIVKRIDKVEEIRQLVEVDDHDEATKMLMEWQGFKTHKQARLHCLRMMRGWRDEIASSVKDLIWLKKYD